MHPAGTASVRQVTVPSDAGPGNDHGTDSGNDHANDHDGIDLDAIQSDLSAVQAALDRLNDGTYWTDEVTGDAIPDHILERRPTVRTAS